MKEFIDYTSCIQQWVMTEIFCRHSMSQRSLIIPLKRHIMKIWCVNHPFILTLRQDKRKCKEFVVTYKNA